MPQSHLLNRIYCWNTCHNPTKQVPIEHLTINDFVLSLDNRTQTNVYSIASTHHYVADYYIKFRIKNSYICCAPNQQFYSTTGTCVKAKKLKPTDILQCYDNSTVFIETVEHVHQKVDLYELSVDKSHTFCVSPYGIIAHNYEPATLAATTTLALAFPPAAPIIITTQALIGGIATYFAYKKYQKNKTFAQLTEELKNSSCNSGSPKKPNDQGDNKDEKENHPHGIYQDAPYHHKIVKMAKVLPQKMVKNAWIILCPTQEINALA